MRIDYFVTDLFFLKKIMTKWQKNERDNNFGKWDSDSYLKIE